MINQIFNSILLMSTAGSILSLFLLLIKPLTRRLFSPKWQYYIWLMVIFILLVPISYKLPCKIPVQIQQSNYHKSENKEVYEVKKSEEKTYKIINQQQIASTSKPSSNPILQQSPIKKNLNINDIIFNLRNISHYLSIIWVLGAISILIYKTTSYTMFSKSMLKNSTILTQYNNRIPKRLSVRSTSMLDTPVLLGIIKPILLLPDIEIKDHDLQYILMHELTHYNRKDILYKWLTMFVCCLHWFNPIVYIISKQIDEYCELSCDLEVASKLDETERKNYMRMILDIISTSKCKKLSLTTQMASSKKILKKRFSMIKNFKFTKKSVVFISMIIAFMIFGTTVFAICSYNGSKTNDNNIANDTKDSVNATNNKINFLILGLDNSNHYGSVFLVSLNENKNSISTLAIPTDTLIVDDNKNFWVSHLKSFDYGTKEVTELIKNNLSVNIDYYAEISVGTVENLIDLLDGINYDIPFDMMYSDPYDNININIPKGEKVLTGEQCYQVCKFYPVQNGRKARIETQQKLISEAIKQKLNDDYISKLPKIYNKIIKDIKTNFSNDDLQQYKSTLKACSKNPALYQYILPGEYENKKVVYYDMQAYCMDKIKTDKIIKEHFN